MSENKIKEFIIAIDEYFDELKNKYKKQRDDILDVLKCLSEIDIAVKSGKKDVSTAIVLFFQKL